jgi:hypothetical protein
MVTGPRLLMAWRRVCLAFGWTCAAVGDAARKVLR